MYFSIVIWDENLSRVSVADSPKGCAADSRKFQDECVLSLRRYRRCVFAELRGRGLHAFAEPVVRFGGLDADVVDSDEDGRRLRVLTPAGEAPGEVDVSCVTLGGEADLSAGFAYVEEGSGEGSGEGSAEGSGG